MITDIDAIEKSTRTTIDVEIGKNDKTGDTILFKVLGPGSDEYIAAERSIQILNIKEAALRRSTIDLTSEEGATVVADGADRREWMKIHKCVVGWAGFTLGGKPAPFTPENLEKVLKARPMWARQIISKIEDEAAFSGG